MRVFSSILLSNCLAAACVLAPEAAGAQAGESSLRAAVDAAWQRAPDARTLEARRDEAGAALESARSWIAGAPTLGLSQRNETSPDTGRGARESEVSVATPLWLPGQRRARSALAEEGETDLAAQHAATRLAIAGQVRERLWAVETARAVHDELEDHLRHLEAIAAEVDSRVKAGDLARTDGMVAQQEVLAASARVSGALLAVQAALRDFRLLTGLADTPPAVPEAIAAAPAEPHPRLLAARTAVKRAQASMAVVSAARHGPPTVGLSVRKENDGYVAGSQRSVGVAVQVPFGPASRNRPLEAAARTQLVTASAEAAQLEQAIPAEIAHARTEVALTQEALAAASARAALAREHHRLIENAFRLGERGLADILRSQSLVHESSAAERQQEAAAGLAHARLNQAMGILP